MTGGNASLIVPLNADITISPDSVTVDPVEDGDELAVFTPEGDCAGTLAWDGAAAALAMWEDDPTSPPKDGFTSGDTLTYRLWDASSDREIAATSVRYANPSNPSGLFANDAVYFLSELALGRAQGVGEEGGGDVPAFAFTFESNYPNPFTTRTTFRYAIPEPARVRLEIYDLRGRRVAVLADEHLGAGWHETSFGASGLANGPYIARLTAGTHAETQRITLVR